MCTILWLSVCAYSVSQHQQIFYIGGQIILRILIISFPRNIRRTLSLFGRCPNRRVSCHEIPSKLIEGFLQVG